MPCALTDRDGRTGIPPEPCHTQGPRPTGNCDRSLMRQGRPGHTQGAVWLAPDTLGSCAVPPWVCCLARRLLCSWVLALALAPAGLGANSAREACSQSAALRVRYWVPVLSRRARGPRDLDRGHRAVFLPQFHLFPSQGRYPPTPPEAQTPACDGNEGEPIRFLHFDRLLSSAPASTPALPKRTSNHQTARRPWLARHGRVGVHSLARWPQWSVP